MSIFQPFSSSPPDHRFLYDEAFLDSGCNPTIFEQEGGGLDLTTVDDTVGTWSTNYAILVVGLLGAFRFGCMMEPIGRRWLWTTGYFLFTGLGYGLAGVNHQIQETKTDPNFYYISFILTVLGAMSLQYQIGVLIANNNDRIRKVYTMVVSLIGLGMIVLLVVLSNSLIYVGFYLVASNFWFLIYYGKFQKDWVVSVGCIIMLVGFGLQLFWDPTCGDGGYADCFQDCILPNPRVFNHNGVFHVLVAIGLSIHIFARFVSSESSPSSNEEDGQGGEAKASEDHDAVDDEVVQPVESLDEVEEA